MQEINDILPFSLMKMAFHAESHHGLNKTTTTASRDDDLAL
jgi:hypothetical protein